MPGLNSWWYRLLEDYVYALPEPPKRTRTKPMEALCVGMPRSATESLQHPLLTLGYDHTYHGWAIVYEEPNYSEQWVRLCPADFDAVLGHSVAVTDAAASVFAAELIAAYPEAKVVLNCRKDLDAWHRSATTTILRSNGHWAVFALSCLSYDGFWAWHVFVRFMWPGLFPALDGNIKMGIARNGKWVYKEHCNMIRGLVPKDRLLEWTVEDGWEPLCKFLNKPVPDEPFPLVNTAAGWDGHETSIAKKYIRDGLWTLAILTTVIAIAGSIFYKLTSK
ncbi:hypothetical protein QQZ08_000418 [Neonectria magnoliae]|uniref:NAD dependent epimerase/dehydratase n=1 Tax=Neonectria magnoliae TaxID=2732573 RepID=A0ABR1IK41_9HYPO